MTNGEILVNIDGKLKAYKPLVSQKKFHKSKDRNKLYSGAFGSGKTLSGCIEALKQSMKYSNNFGVITRLTYPELRDTTRRTFLNDIYIKFEGEEPEKLVDSPLVVGWNKTENHLKFYNGSEILFRSLDSPEKLKSLNLGWFYIDEGSEITEEVFKMLQGRLRLSSVGQRKGWITTNPDTQFHWIHKFFINEKRKNYFAVHSTTLENVHLPEDYIESLEDFDEDYYNRYVLGKWGVFEGLVYKEFSEDLMIDKFDKNVVNVCCSIDWGYKNPTAMLLFFVDNNDVVYVIDEYYERYTLIDDWINQLKKWRDKYHIQIIYADPSEPAYINQISDSDFNIKPAKNEIMPGINFVKKFIKAKDIKILKKCVNLKKEFHLYKWKKEKGEINEKEEPLKLNDHLMDGLRYFIYSHFFNVVPKLRQLSSKGKPKIQTAMDLMRQEKYKRYSKRS